MTTLYHYTSLDTFLKIIQGGKIRLSDLSQSNDALEGRHILDELKDAIRTSKIPAPYHETMYEILDDHMSYSGVLGFCLSEKPDQLSQWRGYGDDGFGICLGFNRAKLEAAVRRTSKMSRHAKLVEVGYGTSATDTIRQTMIKELEGLNLDPAKTLEFDTEITNFLIVAAPNQEDVTTAANTSWITLFNAAARAFEYKSSSFSEEAEHRILVDNSTANYESTIDYSATRSRIVAYTDVNFDDSLTDIVIGPKCDVSNKEISRVLRRYSNNNPFAFSKNRIRKSASTYR